MAGNDGIVISNSAPSEFIGNMIWLRILENHGREWYEWNGNNWSKMADEDAPAMPSDVTTEINTAINNHASDAAAHHPIPDGITGSKVLGGYRFTFTAGLLTGFEEV